MNISFLAGFVRLTFGLEGELVKSQRSKVSVSLNVVRSQSGGFQVSVKGLLETKNWALLSQTGYFSTSHCILEKSVMF